MFGKKSSLIGLDIGSYAVKIVHLMEVKGTYRLKDLGIAQLPPSVIVEGAIKDPDEVQTAIKKLVTNLKTKVKGVATSIAGWSVIIKKVDLPQMSEEELNSFKENPEKVEALREEVRADAVASVKATFIVDALAKKEEVNVDDQEVSQAIYYEAMMSGQDPQEVIKYYQENNLLPAVKMGMIEDKLFGKMLGLDK